MEKPRRGGSQWNRKLCSISRHGCIVDGFSLQWSFHLWILIIWMQISSLQQNYYRITPVFFIETKKFYLFFLNWGGGRSQQTIGGNVICCTKGIMTPLAIIAKLMRNHFHSWISYRMRKYEESNQESWSICRRGWIISSFWWEVLHSLGVHGLTIALNNDHYSRWSQPEWK